MPLKIRKERPIYDIVYEDGDDSATFKCHILSTAEVAKMAEESTKHIWDAPKRRIQKQRFDKLDMAKFHADKIDKIIVGWEGLLDPNGRPLPCTRENKLLLEEVNPEIIEYVLDQVDHIADNLDQDEKDELKNSDPSQNGSPQEI